MNMARRLTTGLVLAFFFIISMSAKDIDIRTCGAKGDGRTFATKALQKAIDNVSAAGGGRVIVSGGTYLIKPVRMKSGVELYIDADATLVENMSFSNIEMSGVTSWPISFMVSDNEEVMFEGIRNISFDNTNFNDNR